MSKAFLYVYLNNNFGDDLFVDIIAKRYPETKFYVPCSECGIKTIKNPNVYPVVENWFYRAVNKVSRILFKKRLLNILLVKWCDISVYLGGSLFIEDSTWKERFRVLQEFVKYSEQFCIIGANFGPYDSWEYEDTHRKFFGTLSDVCFRDAYSYQLFAPKMKHIRQAPDVAFCLKKNLIFPVEKIVTIACVSVEERTDLKQDAETYAQSHIKICEAFSERGYRINLVSLCEPQGDLKTCRQIYDGLSLDAKNCTEIKRYYGNLDEIIESMGRSEIIFAGRFHSMIIGWILGRNTIPVIYSDKMKNVIQDIQYTGLAYDLREEFEFSIEDIINNRDKKPCKLEQYIADADKQFQYLDKALYERRKG